MPVAYLQKQNTVKKNKTPHCSEICPILTYHPILNFAFLQHLKVMEDMLKDFLLGQHLLLVGNQVGHLLYILRVGHNIGLLSCIGILMVWLCLLIDTGQ